jgi:DNA polymerase-3 subunit beta
MKLHLTKADLFQGIQTVQSAISVRSTLPVLGNILFEASDKGVRLSATDLEVGIRTWIKADVIENGAVTIPAKILADFLRTLEDDREVKIDVSENNKVEVRSGRDRLNITGLPKEDYPVLPEFEEAKAVTIPAGTIREMLKKTMFAASADETRYVLNGILFSFKDKTLKLVATDGRRLAIMERALPELGNFKKDIIVPTKAIQELGRNLGDEGDANFYFKENQIQINLGAVTIISRLIEGEYPNYEQVIPKKTKDELKIGTQDFLQAARRASILTSQDSQSIKINIIKDRMIITKNTPDLGEAREELEVDYKGSDLAIGFNPNFLIDVLKNIEEENVKFCFIDPEKPAVIKNGDHYTYVVLPMQVS